MSKAKIQKMINNAPPSWLEMFKRYKLGRKPTVDRLINTVLEHTPTMASSGERGAAKYKVPAKVRKEAMKGLELSWKNNYTSASGIGLVRAMQLVVKPKIWERSVHRMKAYFTRHQSDKQGEHFGDDRKPSRGYLAWLVWGGDSGFSWAKKMVGSKQNPRVSKRSLTNPRRRRKNPKMRTWKEDDIIFETYYVGLPSDGFYKTSHIEVMLNSPYLYPPTKYHSISNFFVPEHKRGTGDAKRLLAHVVSKYGDHPISAQVSSAPSLVLFYRNGFKVTDKPSASLEEALQMLEESGYSLNMRNILPSQLKKNPRRRRNRDTSNIRMPSSWDLPFREGSVVQTIMFSTKHFNGRQARAWLHKHGFKAPKMDKTANYMRYRQFDPKMFNKDSFRTLEFKKGVLAVIGIPKQKFVKNPKRRRNRWEKDSLGHRGAACKRWEVEGTAGCPKGSSRSALVRYRASPRGQAAQKRLFERIERSTKGYLRKEVTTRSGTPTFYYYIVGINNKGEKYLKRVTKQVAESVRK